MIFFRGRRFGAKELQLPSGIAQGNDHQQGADIMDLPKELEFKQLSIEDKYHRALPGYMKRIRDIYKAVHERFGEEGLDLIRDVSTAYGTQIAMNVKKKRELKGVAEVGRYLLKVFDMVSSDWEIQEFSEERLVIRVDRCPYPLESEAVCKAHTNMEKALVSTLDDTLEHRIGCCIPAGDPVCEHILARKTGRDQL
jgi:hypothetical protein